MSTPQFLDNLRGKSRKRRETLVTQSGARHLAHEARNDLLPRLDLMERDIASLRPPARNVRRADPAHISEVADSILALGFCVPVLIDQNGGVLDGWVRVEAARLAGLSRIPCVLAGHLDASERRLLRIALNRRQEKGDWDLAELRLEMNELIIEDARLDLTGFTEIEIDQIRLDDEPEPVEQGGLEPEPDAKPIAKLGDIFRLGSHRIACGDARDPELLSRLMAGEKARLVLTDVPYNVKIRGHVTSSDHREFAMASGEMDDNAFGAFNGAWIEAAVQHLTEGGILGTFIDWRGYPSIMTATEAHALEQLNLVVWAKTNAGMGSLYRSGHELLPLFKKGRGPHVNNVELGRHGRWRSNVWTYPGASSFGSDARQGLKSHPTVKPTALLEDALLDLSHRNEIVLDPFLGSGSTLIAAEACGRICRGIEIDPLYVDVAIRRYQTVTGRAAVLEAREELPV